MPSAESGPVEPGTLYVVSVPIGNLDDVTLRALKVLRSVTRIACEDTRRTGKLLELLELPKRPLVSYHAHNEAQRTPELVAALEEGASLALVSDAGTPAISDPGERLVRAVAEAGLPVVPVPGACAAIAALAASGLPTDRFRFIGFLPPKSGARRRALSELAGADETLVFYVAPHRVEAVLGDMVEAFGDDRPAVLARELTKTYEELRRGTLDALRDDTGTVRGEVVLLVGGAPERAPEAGELEAVVAALLAEGRSPSRAAKEAARRTGASRNDAYAAALRLKEGSA